VIVEDGGREEVIGGSCDGRADDASAAEHDKHDAAAAAAAAAAADEDADESVTPHSADLSLDTPKSYMSATGQLLF
jgi:hypothetical protein